MYLSHPIRRMRENPLEGESVTVVVHVEDELTQEDTDAVETEIERVGGTIEDRLPFDGLCVQVAQEQLDDLCSVSGLKSIETDNVLGIRGDPSEDM